MSAPPESMALKQAHDTCRGHAQALGEDVVPMPALERFNRLEQLGWLPSADEWMELRQVRNQFTHEYPESAEERFERFSAAVAAATRLVDLLDGFKRRLERL